MASTYLFFQPVSLPLSPSNLDADAVAPLLAEDRVRELLSGVLPELNWVSPREGRVELDGRWLEFSLCDGAGTLSLRCSLRADYTDVVQKLCDQLGWVAFDERPFCFQPHHEPFPA
jgi:hypothetical protein